jgi:hypothetical protein
MLGHVEVEDATALVGEHDQDKEHAQARCGNREEIERHLIPDVIGEERPPWLGRRGAPLRHQPGDGPLGHLDAELHEFDMESGGAPQKIRRGHFADKGDDLGVDWRTAHPRPAGELGPVLVSGVTIRRGCFHPAQILASQTQKRRSVRRSLGRVAVLLYTASCWRRARFSRTSWGWPPQETEQVEQDGNHRAGIVSGSEPTDQPPARRRDFGEGQVHDDEASTRVVVGRPLAVVLFDRGPAASRAIQPRITGPIAYALLALPKALHGVAPPLVRIEVRRSLWVPRE